MITFYNPLHFIDKGGYNDVSRNGEVSIMPSKNDQIESLEAEISALPIGCISRKTINGKVRQYHQWTEDGKKRSKYLDDESAEQLRTLIEKRKELQRQLRLIRASSVSKALTKKANRSASKARRVSGTGKLSAT